MAPEVGGSRPPNRTIFLDESICHKDLPEEGRSSCRARFSSQEELTCEQVWNILRALAADYVTFKVQSSPVQLEGIGEVLSLGQRL